MATPDAVAEANAECQTRAEPCAVGDALGTWLQVRGTRHTKFKEHLEAAKVDPTPAFARFADFDASVERSGGLIVCAYWDSAFAKAEGTEKLMPHHFADNRRHANEADGSRSAGELGVAWSMLGLRKVPPPAPPIPFLTNSKPNWDRVELYDRSTSATLCAANCIRTETLAGGRLVVHVLDRPLAPQANHPAVVLGAAAATAGPSDARSDAGATAATAASARGRRPSAPLAPVDRCCPALGATRDDRLPHVSTQRAVAHAGGAEWVSAVQRAAAAATPLVALAARTLRLLQLEHAAHGTRACTLFVPVDDAPGDRDGGADADAEREDGAGGHRKCRAALLEASAGRYVLREGRARRCGRRACALCGGGRRRRRDGGAAVPGRLCAPRPSAGDHGRGRRDGPADPQRRGAAAHGRAHPDGRGARVLHR